MNNQPPISHLGIAVSDLDAAIEKYKLLTGEETPQIEEVADQSVKVAIFGGTGTGRIELVSPTNEQSPIAKFIAKKGEGLHHVCIFVDDIEKKLQELKDAGMRLIDESPRIGAGGKKIAFVHPSGFGSVLIELEQR